MSTLRMSLLGAGALDLGSFHTYATVRRGMVVWVSLSGCLLFCGLHLLIMWHYMSITHVFVLREFIVVSGIVG